MCTGMEVLALASLAGTVGGTYMQNEARADSQKAQRKASMAELLRQDEFDKQRMDSFTDALGIADQKTQQGNIDEATAERKALFESQALPAEASYESPAASGTPKVVKDYRDQKSAEAEDFVSSLGDARARLGAWGEGMFDFGQALNDRSFDLNELNRRAGTSAEIGSMEAQLAGQEAGQDKAFLGNLFTGLGGVGLGYAGSQGAMANMFKPTGTAAVSTVPGTPGTRSSVAIPNSRLPRPAEYY